MSKKRKVSKLRINDSVQEKLDSIQEIESTEVYKPKEEVNIELQFLAMLGEEEFSVSNEEIKVKNPKSLEKGKINFLDIILILVAILGIIGLIAIIMKLLS